MQDRFCRTAGRYPLQRKFRDGRECTRLFCRISSWTVWPESRFRSTVCEIPEWRGRTGDPFCHHVCDRRRSERWRVRSYQTSLHQSGWFPGNRHGKTGNAGCKIWRACRCGDPGRISGYAGGRIEETVRFFESCNDLQRLFTYPELLQIRRTPWSVHDRDSCSGYLLVWSLPSYNILNGTEECCIYRWILPWADRRHLSEISGWPCRDLQRKRR